MSPAGRGSRGFDAVRTSTLVDTSGADAFLARRIARMSDTRPAFREVAGIIRGYYRRQYQSGDGWVALSDSYAARKASRGRGSRILVDQGLLESSLTREGVRYAKQRLTRDSVEVKSNDPVGNLLTNGTRRMPARDPGRIDLRGVTRDSRRILLAWVSGGGS